MESSPLDDFNRQGLAMEVDISLHAVRVIRSLEQSFNAAKSPIRPLRQRAGVHQWCPTGMGRATGHALSIQPGHPQQNAHVERYNRIIRYTWLASVLFSDIEQVQNIANDWLWTCNNERPNMVLGGITPMQKFALAA